MRLGTLKFKAIGIPQQDDIYFASSVPASAPRPVSQIVFGWKEIVFDGPPNWHCSVLAPDRCVDKTLPWSQALAAVPAEIDVKEIWELSRFYWLPQLALEARKGDASANATLNTWFRNWESQNPSYLGINWACGQEAAIRILHCAQAAIILDEVDRPQAALVRFIANSAARIAPTLHYALGQANNHGSAEAAGLFVAGTWLDALNADPRAKHWKKLGRRWLENRAEKLILDDGSSNQYSTNYHRVVLDTYSFAEVWRRRINAPSFSIELISRLGKASRWLYEVTDIATGRAPAFGANDGSLLLSGLSRNYQDFRHSIQLGVALFDNVLAYNSDRFDDLLLLYEIDRPETSISAQASKIFRNGGYITLRNASSSAIMRYPEYKFRPSHCDALHLDFHVNGEPILFDGGTFSYAKECNIDLTRASAHNSIEFDGRDQMSRISPFLYGDWLEPSSAYGPENRDGVQYCHAAYRDRYGCEHDRSLYLKDNLLTVRDNISGFKNNAILRWRFSYSDYVLEEGRLFCNGIWVELIGMENINSIRVIPSTYSPNYLKMEKCHVLEIEVCKPGEIVTEVRF